MKTWIVLMAMVASSQVLAHDLSAQLTNNTSEAISAQIQCSYDVSRISSITVQPGETKNVQKSDCEFDAITVTEKNLDAPKPYIKIFYMFGNRSYTATPNTYDGSFDLYQNEGQRGSLESYKHFAGCGSDGC
jgi:hypothetical protein